MAQNLLDQLDESMGMEEYDLGRAISDAAMQRGISQVEMRGQLLQTVLQDDGKTISDKNRDLYAMGEISLAEAVKRSKVDRTLRTDVKALSEKVQEGIAGLRPKFEDFQEYITGVPSFRGAEAGMGRTLSDLDQVQALAGESAGRTLSDTDLAIGRTMSNQDLKFLKGQGSDRSRALIEQIKNLERVLAESGKNISDRDRYFLESEMGDLDAQLRTTMSLNDYFELQDRQRIKAIQEGRTISDEDLATGRIFSDQDLSGRTLSDLDLTTGRTMSDQDFATEQSSQDFQRRLQGILMESGATISDRDRQFLEMMIGDFVDPRTLSDRDRQIIQDIQGRTLSNRDLGGGGRTLSDSDAAILEILK